MCMCLCVCWSESPMNPRMISVDVSVAKTYSDHIYIWHYVRRQRARMESLLFFSNINRSGRS